MTLRVEKVVSLLSIHSIVLSLISTAGNVLAVCMCSHASMEHLYTWLHKLQQDYPALKDAAAVYNVSLDQDSYSTARLCDSSNTIRPLTN